MARDQDTRVIYHDLAQQYADQRDEIMAAMESVALSGQLFTGNSEVTRLEETISTDYQNRTVVSCRSGTDALILALQDMKLTPGSRVAIPAWGYIATANAVVAAGLTPLFIDIDDRWLMDVEDLAQQLELHRDVEAVIPVDLYGQAFDLTSLSHLRDRWNFKILVDSAQSWNVSRPTADLALFDYMALSFNPLKSWGALGSAGAVITNSGDPLNLRRMMHQNGGHGNGIFAGYNARIDALQAAVLNVRHDYAVNTVAMKRNVARYYDEALPHHLQRPRGLATGTCYSYPIAFEDPTVAELHLQMQGIESVWHYRTHLSGFASMARFRRDCPRAQALSGKVIAIPCHRHLSVHQIEWVISALASLP